MSTLSNMTLIETKTAGSGGAANFDFTGIANTYTDLYILVSGRSSADSVEIRIQFNNDTGTNYYTRALYGSGTAAASTSTNFAFLNPFGDGFSSATTNVFGSASIYIPNYAGSTQKSVSIDGASENNATEAYSAISAGLWTGTAAITSIKMTGQTGTWIEGSTASLYGIKGASKVAKATGGNISYTNGYWVHTFNASGTFTPTANLTDVEYIVVAGGGGGGYFYGGGGGAGGYRSSVTGESSGGGASAESKLSLTSGTAYTVTVGAGGANATSTAGGNDGNSSAFDTITTVGGGGGGWTNQPGRSGGSGGGGGGQNNGISGGSGTTSQGFAGATSSGGAAGGGGGAGSSHLGGGAGVQSSINGIATYRAGGAAGNSGSNSQPGSVGANSPGPANSGTGGGGAGSTNPAALAGGSGVVIVRYAA